jgi:hypothetical protein
VPAHRTFYQELQDMWESGTDKIDMITFSSWLEAKGLLESVGGRRAVTDLQLHLSEVFNFRPTLGHLSHHIDIVLSFSKRRQAFELLTKGARFVYDRTRDDDQIDSVLDAIDSKLASLRSQRRLEMMQDAAAALEKPIVKPPDVIEGILSLGGKLIFGGSSKAYKTWGLTDLAISVATGSHWLNGYATRKGKVFYVNFELMDPIFWGRVRDVCDEHQLHVEPGMLTVVHLRGRLADWPRLARRIRHGQYDLIIIDPIYKLLLLLGRSARDRDENSAGTIATLLNELEILAVRTGASVAFGSHYSKGNQSAKESIDRIGGSGVFARDPDSVITFTKHEDDDCFTVDMTLRNHKPVESFVVRWEHPLFIPDSTLDPTKLKRVGRPRKYDPKEILELIDEPMLASEIVKLAKEELGINERRVFESLRELKQSGKLKQAEKRAKYERV